jgi:Rha family phage regulatory protein
MADQEFPTTEDLLTLITVQPDGLMTDSRAIAIAFKKQHRSVLYIIGQMIKSTHPEIREHTEHNLVLSAYMDKTGRKLPMYRMTAKGMAELTMGFTGEPARVIRIRFLNAFEEMAERLERRDKSLTERMLEWERTRDIPSKLKGSIGSKLMHQRRKDLPQLEAERLTFLELGQPSLFGLH